MTELELFPWQKEDVMWLLEKTGGIVAHDMGLGKTGITLSVLAVAGGKALVIGPKSMIGQWVEEAARWTPQLDVREHVTGGDVTITNYERLLSRFDYYYQEGWEAVVVDEAQRIKNWKTKIAKAAKKLKAKRRIALSATPIENKLEDLHSIMEFIGVDVGKETVGYSADVLLNPQNEVARYVARALAKKKVKPVLSERIMSSVGDWMIRRRLDDMIEMPALMVERVDVILSDKERKLYNKIMSGLKATVEERKFDVTNALARLTYARQVCNGIPTLMNEQGISTKIAQVLETCDEVVGNGYKIVLFSEFLKTAANVVTELENNGLTVAELSGRVQDYDVEKSKDWDVIVCTKSGEFGHNLQQASYVFNIDLPYNPARVLQRMGRARRIGQKDSVVVANFVAKDTVEERILDILYQKRRLFYDYVDVGVSMDQDLIRKIVIGES